MTLLHTLFSAPPTDWLLFAGFFVGILLFIIVAEKARSLLGWPAEVNRKLVHVGTGLLIFFCAFLFESNVPLIWMAIIFMLVNLVGVRTGLLKGMHGTQRHTYGTVYYPLTFLILVATCWENHKVILMMSMLILSISDAAAAIVGESLKDPHVYNLAGDTKSREGSLTMLLTTLLLFLFILPRIVTLDQMEMSLGRALWIGIIVATVATALEALSSGGSDNLTAPLGAAYILFLMLSGDRDYNTQVTLGFTLALLVGWLSYKAKFLSPSGSVATFLLGTVIFGAGGLAWTLPILTFFILSSLLSKMGKKGKARFDLIFEKSSTRDVGQVIANGGIAGFAVVLYTFFPNPIWYAVYLGAVAAVNADTWATEIGVFSRFKPRSIFSLKQVEHGTSGGITPLGCLASLLGSLLIALSGFLVAPKEFGIFPGSVTFWILTAAGLTGSLVDSLLGATIQAQYRCLSCKKVTEKKSHCGIGTTRISGFEWMDNDRVNVLCAFSAALLVMIFCVLLDH